ncbi:immunity protein YezG family protein [Bacillus toyonensis]|uniref:immunity protein YezG family protein n=1 Tax=Bacillus toyonensis TaxID=155322 RepID=UPI000BF8CAA0|nr:immunity protein YezG family protein [Bacillus toyonensis]PFX85858.1 GNAT family acetyltransferase [Bacillus toyonensis]
MSFENELNKLYRKIAEKINDMIPVEWEEFYFNGEVKDGEGGVYFFYTTLDEKQEYKYSHYIPRMYNVDRKIYNQFLHELFDLTVQLQQVFIDNQQEAWFSVTMIVNGEGKLTVRFSYVNWNDSEFGPSDRIFYFEYKYLNRELTDEIDKELMARMKKYEEERS